MPYLRHAPRHIQRTLQDHIHYHMDLLGWFGTPAPFGTSPARWITARIDEALGSSAVAGNVLAVTFGDELDDEEAQLGGGLAYYDLPLFVDCVGESEPVALAMASDVKDVLSGRAPDTSRFVKVREYTTADAGVAVPWIQLEMTDVIREKGMGADWRGRWHTVKATVVVTHPGES